MRLELSSTSSRAIQTTRKLVLLAPGSANLSYDSDVADPEYSRYGRILSALQTFRGSIYMADGALKASDLDVAGRHRTDADLRSWHLVALNDNGEVCGCSRYRVHAPYAHFSELSVSRSTLAKNPEWRPKLVSAIDQLRSSARQRRVDFVEVGGWAIAENLRRSAEAIRIALSTYALANRLGGCIGITTATMRHQSATVLRKIGGTPLVTTDGELPAYYDNEYDCDMQILSFDSASPNPNMIGWIEQLRDELSKVEIVRPTAPVHVSIQRAQPWTAPTWHQQRARTAAFSA